MITYDMLPYPHEKGFWAMNGLDPKSMDGQIMVFLPPLSKMTEDQILAEIIELTVTERICLELKIHGIFPCEAGNTCKECIVKRAIDDFNVRIQNIKNGRTDKSDPIR